MMDEMLHNVWTQQMAENYAVLRHIAEAVAQLDTVETMEDYLTCPFACGGVDVILGSPERFAHTVDCPIIVARTILQSA